MKKAIQAILILSVLIVLGFVLYYFILFREERQRASFPVMDRIVEMDKPGNGARWEKSAEEKSQAKVQVLEGETILDAIDLNLDADEELEQVLTVRPTEAETSRISIVTADFEPSTGSYLRTWKGETLAVRPNAVVVQARDLLQDGSIEILVYGIGASNLQTLTIFKPSFKRAAAYKTIFSGEGQSITMEEPNKINLFVRGPAGASPFDRIKISYAWNPRLAEFQRTSEYRVPGTNIEELLTANILTGKSKDFENYLSGLWEMEPTAGHEASLIHFSPAEKKISFRTGETQEEWDWADSSASLAGIYATITNSTVPDLIRLLDIELVGMDRIKVNAQSQQIMRFSTSEVWNGTYRRYKGGMPDSRHEPMSPIHEGGVFEAGVEGGAGKIMLGIEELEGSYTASGGRKLSLEKASFSLADGKQTASGNYSVFRMDSFMILDLHPIDRHGLPEGRLCYIFTVAAKGGKGIGTLILKPARICTDRAELLYEPDIRFVKN
ncbi:MAG: pallilysin-related adhesin [Spirochaetaceae bacterium]|nr:pallilysin-related adhesin [Spirochaetaceae bacterium]